MTFKEYADTINKLLEENPKIGYLPVCYAIDEEGNGYHMITNEPVLMEVENINEYYLEQAESQANANVVCIN